MVLAQPVPIDKVPHANNPLTLSTGNGCRGGSDSLPMISLEPVPLKAQAAGSNLPPPQLSRRY